MLKRIADGRTDLVFEYVEAGHPATSRDTDGVSLLEWCAYYGDVSAIRFLLAHGEVLASLGENLGLNGAVYHGHWQLVQFLVEHGADADLAAADTGETPLHSALCKPNRLADERVVKVLLANGADPTRATRESVETGAFMRDCRTRGETPLHRAAAFASETILQLLLDAGARPDVKDANGDSPLTWASWHLRPAAILRKLCYGDFHVRPDYAGLESHLLGEPHE